MLALVVRHRVVAPIPVRRAVIDQGDVVREVFGRATIESRRVAHEQGTAVVIVTHDHRSLDVFDATYEMEDGRLSSRAQQT